MKLQELYTEHYLRPQFESLGRDLTFIHPWHVKLFGEPISMGDCANVIATAEKKVRLTIWSDSEDKGSIRIGDYCLLCPGVRISAATEIVIEDNTMLASDAYITDSDWHDIYDRVTPIGRTAPVRIEQNVWIGDGVIVCKGVTIGKNSVIGARSVVVDSVPENAIAAGNPAKVVKYLDSNEEMKTRAHWFEDTVRLFRQIDDLDRDKLQGNTLYDWIRSLLMPRKTD